MNTWEDPNFDPMETIIPSGVKPKTGRIVYSEPSELVTSSATIMTASGQTAPVEEVTKSETDSSYFGVHPELPSSMLFYAYKKISVRPYRLAEMFKLGAANKSGRVRPIMEAVAACIDRPIDRVTMVDFNYLCYWLRSMSYKQNPFNVTWDCESVKHYRQVALGEVEASTLSNTHTFDKGQLTTTKLIESDLSNIAQSLVNFGVGLYAPTVADFVELSEEGDKWDDETLFIAKYASLIHTGHGLKLFDRIKFLKGLGNTDKGVDIIELLEQAQKEINKCGVTNVVETKCKHCQGMQKVVLEIDLHSFFPLSQSFR